MKKFVLLPVFALLLLSQSAAAREPDLEIGEEINELCAGCHGEFGQGGKGGEYPRLAGQPAKYIERQMHLYRDRKRKNLAMVEYVDERQAPDEDIQDIAAYLSQIKLLSRLPPIDEEEEFDPLERLLLAKKTVNIARFEGDVKKGRKLYRWECKGCHGDKGEGDQENGIPMLAGQYTNYLLRSVDKYKKGLRVHDIENPEDQLLSEFTDEDLRNIFAYLSTVDDQ